MDLGCTHIEEAVNIVLSSDNKIIDVTDGWEKVKRVVSMEKKLTENERNTIGAAQPTLRHWSFEKTPHNPAQEGYTCDLCKVGLTFPK